LAELTSELWAKDYTTAKCPTNFSLSMPFNRSQSTLATY